MQETEFLLPEHTVQREVAHKHKTKLQIVASLQTMSLGDYWGTLVQGRKDVRNWKLLSTMLDAHHDGWRGRGRTREMMSSKHAGGQWLVRLAGLSSSTCSFEAGHG